MVDTFDELKASLPRKAGSCLSSPHLAPSQLEEKGGVAHDSRVPATCTCTRTTAVPLTPKRGRILDRPWIAFSHKTRLSLGTSHALPFDPCFPQVQADAKIPQNSRSTPKFIFTNFNLSHEYSRQEKLWRTELSAFSFMRSPCLYNPSNFSLFFHEKASVNPEDKASKLYQHCLQLHRFPILQKYYLSSHNHPIQIR
jgi:hypothetical protein